MMPAELDAIEAQAKKYLSRTDLHNDDLAGPFAANCLALIARVRELDIRLNSTTLRAEAAEARIKELEEPPIATYLDRQSRECRGRAQGCGGGVTGNRLLSRILQAKTV